MSQKIKYVLMIICGLGTQRSPNPRYAFRLTRCSDGVNVEGRISGGDSNILWAVGELGLKTGEYYYYTKEMSSREFDNYISSFLYVGSEPKEIAKHIKAVFDNVDANAIPLPETVEIDKELIIDFLNTGSTEGCEDSEVFDAALATKIREQVFKK